MAKVRSLGCNPPPFRHSSSCRRDCFRPKAYCHSDCLTMIHSHKIAPKLNLGNHSSWGNGPWATIPPRGMVPFGTSWASRLTFLVQTLISLVRLVPKMFTKVHILVPKRTIPLGGMVALGPFPQEEWFPPPLIWHRKGRQRGEHRRRKTKNRTSFEFENMKSIRTRVGRVSLEKQSRNACTNNAGAQ